MKTINKENISQITFVESKDSGNRVEKNTVFRIKCINGKLNSPIKDFLVMNPTWTVEDGIIYTPHAVQVHLNSGAIHTELFRRDEETEALKYYYQLSNQIENTLTL